MNNKERVKEMHDFYIENKSISKVSKKFNCCTKSLKNWFNKDGLLYPIPDYNKRLNYNEKYFDIIDNQKKAYLLGYFFADGGMYERTRYKNDLSKSISLNCVLEDRELLDFFARELNFEGTFLLKKETEFLAPNKKFYTRKKQISFSITSKYLFDSLVKFGLGSRKTYKDLHLPNLKKEFKADFIRGYFDGDGCISGKDNRISVSFTSKTNSLLDSLSIYLTENNIKSSVRYEKNRDVYNLIIYTIKDVHKFYNFIYNNHSFCLKRKYVKFNEVLLKSGELLEKQEIVNQQPS